MVQGPFRLSLLRRGLLILSRPWLWSVKKLSEQTLLPDPFDQFAVWYKRATHCITLQFPEALCLSTIGRDGYPEGRFVLLKGFDKSGFVFYTNSESRKGQSLESCPKAALSFYWEPLQRQVRIQGNVERISGEEADQYFRSRPRISRLGAWASQQSRPLESRGKLLERLAEFKRKFRGQEVPRPSYWIGYRVVPVRMEFWELRANRLHDRFQYEKNSSGSWEIKRLYP